MKHMTSLRYFEAVAREKSIRKAAETLAITSTALNRRILTLEDEIGQPLFERLPSGVRLNTAGEIFLQHIRSQFSDLERVKSQIADLTGIRRGHISLSCTPEALKFLLPQQIARYRREHPGVTFSVARHHRAEAEQALTALQTDIALVFEPIQSPVFRVLATMRLAVQAIMAADHPLAGKERIRLRDCIGYPVILPTERSGIRQLVDVSLLLNPLPIACVVESDSLDFLQHYLLQEDAISFQLPIGMDPTETRLIQRPLDERDAKTGLLHIGQLNGRVLSVAAAKFMDQLVLHAATAEQDG